MFRVVFRVLGALKPHRISYKGVCETHNKRGLCEGGEEGFTGEHEGFTGEHEGFTGEHRVGKPSWMCGSSAAVLSTVRPNVQVLQNFISEEEEADFLQELDPGLKRKRYEFDHWDDAIHGFRETERLQWGGTCGRVVERLQVAAFPEGSPLLGPVHVLDLDKAGFIKPHVDSVKFCGSTIAGLCLLSDSVMRLVSVENSADWVCLLLQRHSLYILRNEARFKFTHEILKDEESFFSGRRIPRQRRISVICRNLPL
ncbi:alpha-ketoglutarate-dependent dioxygenase alkB homolog 7, mitochondrial isoform X2 [Tachysurus vachellii]|uniref:alpha-ketoglutarate-dependent dioxygenase alkB homolog 7, mitochondrial isoform X2 n=1 Tax=Tachysurus vachellii TaxID=175792 RepID=UPI00296A93DE|nr:alpha-ketoglutarate-dependent dioxygenase alkB homolog 7, mitochondrial isoform X2 [Tachysurus vachellii]